MKALEKYIDIHSHDRQKALRGDTIVCISPGEEMQPGGTYSVGIHPWDTDKPITLSLLKALVRCARDARVVAIGECGFDRLRGGEIALQSAVFDFHARLAAQLEKPLIIHAVKADDLLIAAIRRQRPKNEWIIHGFRGKPEAASQLLREGFSLSFGLKFNQATKAATPKDKQYEETD